MLSRYFRRRFLERLEQAFETGELKFFSSLEHLRERDAFQRYLAPLRAQEWVVYAKPPCAGPEQVLDYLARYTHRTAISNHRILDIDDATVRFRWRDYRDGNRNKIMALSAEEFIRRFLLHVLPLGLQRIRYYGFLANRYRKEKLARCRELLGMSIEPPSLDESDTPRDYRDRYEALTGISLRQCPNCHTGRMLIIERTTRRGIAPPVIDTS